VQLGITTTEFGSFDKDATAPSRDCNRRELGPRQGGYDERILRGSESAKTPVELMEKKNPFQSKCTCKLGREAKEMRGEETLNAGCQGGKQLGRKRKGRVRFFWTKRTRVPRKMKGAGEYSYSKVGDGKYGTRQTKGKQRRREELKRETKEIITKKRG